MLPKINLPTEPIKQMARFITMQKEDIGLAPDELVFRGEQKEEEVILHVINFNATSMEEETVKEVSSVKKYHNTDSITWFNVDGLHNISILEEISKVFELDTLVLADVVNTEDRPKVQEYDDCIYVSIKMLQVNPENDEIDAENLSLILTDSVLISFQERSGDVFEPVRERIRRQKKRIRTSGTDYLLFALLDIVIDNYLYVLGLLGEKIDKLEDSLLKDPSQKIINEINEYKSELNYIRRNVKPAKEMVFSLLKTETELFDEENEVHFKDLQYNISQASDTTDSYREILSDLLNIYHTTISSKLNDIMKFLTVFSVIFIPLTFIVGIYGTNFDRVPELHFKYGYFMMWGVIITLAVSMLFYFKRKKWL